MVTSSSLSWPQEVLALSERMRPGALLDPRCAVGRAFLFDEEPDLGLLGRSLADVAACHDAVWTTPVRTRDGLRLAERTPRPVELEVRPLGGRDGDVGRTVLETVTAPYDVDDGPLLRGVWLRRTAGGVLVLGLHHWAGDAGALDALQREVADRYRSAATGGPPPAPPLSYRAVTRREVTDPGRATGRAPSDLQEQLDWWRGELRGLRRGALPVRGAGRTGGATALCSAELRAEASRALLCLTVEHRASPFMVLLAALGGVLEDGRDGRTRDLVVFSVDPGRTGRSRDVLGFLAEPVPLRLRLDLDAPFAAAVDAARTTVLNALRHRGVPFVRLLHAEPRLAVALLRGRRPATLVQYLTLSDLRLDGHRGVALPTFPVAEDGLAHPWVVPVDLDLTVERRGDVHQATLLYDPGLWSTDDMRAALAAVERILVAAPGSGRRLADLREGGR